MLQSLLEAAVESYRAPRRAARRIIDTVDRPEAVALMFGVSFCVSAMLMLLTQSAFGADGANGGLGFVFLNLVFSAFGFGMLVGLVYGVGRLFGGEGELIEVAAVIAWHSLVTVFFTPFVASAGTLDGASGPAFLIQLVCVGVAIWLLVNFIAEVHGFPNAWRVAGVMFVGMFLAGLILPFLFAGLI